MLASWLRSARQVVVLTGAGISTESGIPDFRGPDGVWTKDPRAEQRATIAHYVTHADARTRAWHERAHRPVWDAEPNAGHRGLAELEHHIELHTLVTQNVDGLHQRAGTSPAIVVEIHGTTHEAKCLACAWRGPMEETLARVRAGEADPPCLVCGGMLKSGTVSFGEQLVAADLDRARAAAAGADLFLAIGTSLAVYPVAALPELAVRNGARLVILNAEPTPFDAAAALVLSRQLGTLLPEVVDATRRAASAVS